MEFAYLRRQPGSERAVGENGERTYRESYLLKYDPGFDGYQEISLNDIRRELEALPWPVAYGAPHIEDGTALCCRIHPVQLKADPYLWQIAVEYQTKHGGTDPYIEQLPPDQRQQKWSGRYGQVRKYLSCDLEGWPFADSADTPFNPPPAINIYIDEITVQLYEADLFRAVDESLMGATNMYDWQGYPAGTVLLEDVAFSETFEMGAWWWLKTYKLLISPWIILPRGVDENGQPAYMGGWSTDYILDAGPKELQEDPENPGYYIPVPIADTVDGQKYLDGSPRLLNGGGFRLPSGHEEVYLIFTTKKQDDFSLLPLVRPW